MIISSIFDLLKESGKGWVRRLFRKRAQGELPPLSIAINAGIDTPKTREQRRAFALVPGLKLSGKAGVEVKLSTPTNRRLKTSGRVRADGVHV